MSNPESATPTELPGDEVLKMISSELHGAEAIVEKMAAASARGAFVNAKAGLVRAFARILAAHKAGIWMAVARDLDGAASTFEGSASISPARNRVISDLGAARGCRVAAGALRGVASQIASYLKLETDPEDPFREHQQQQPHPSPEAPTEASAGSSGELPEHRRDGASPISPADPARGRSDARPGDGQDDRRVILP